MYAVDLGSVQSCIDRSLDLLRQTYTSDADGSGWYHRLATGAPGPSATAVGLSSFYRCGHSYEYLREGLGFLQARQVRSGNPRTDGGWAINTSLGHPVTEATGLAARLLGIARVGLVDDAAPDARAACAWLLNNQNADGGWGSYFGQASRIWLTCMALRALARLDSVTSAVSRGVHWLIDSICTEPHGWGVTPGSEPVVPNTAFALIALSETRSHLLADRAAEVCERAYEWLEENVRTDAASIAEDPSYFEVFTVTRVSSDHQVEAWTSTIWHHSLPFALSALVRRPTMPSPALISSAVETIIESQRADGYWGEDRGDGISVWSIWPFLEALADVGRYCVVRGQDRIAWLTSDTVVLRHANARTRL